MKDFENFVVKKEELAKWLKPEASYEENWYRATNINKKYRKNKQKYWNKKEIRNEKIEELKTLLECTVKNLDRASEIYKELYHKTEYWERKSTLDFDFINWNTIRKVNGKFYRYLTELREVERSLKNENNQRYKNRN